MLINVKMWKQTMSYIDADQDAIDVSHGTLNHKYGGHN